MTITTLKMIALIAMTIDHIGEFIPGMPVYLRWIGRISAPVFIFCMAQAMHHTHSRKRYIIRLYLMSILTAILNIISFFMVCYFDRYNAGFIQNNIFGTLFQNALLILVIDYCIQKRPGFWKILFLYIAWNVVSTALIFRFIPDMEIWCNYMLYGPFSNVFIHEGGWWPIVLGLCFYYFPQKRWCSFVIWAFFSVMDIFSVAARIVIRMDFYGWEVLEMLTEKIFQLLGYNTMEIYQVSLLERYQWMMMFAFPIIYFYNGKYGRGFKKLFYIYYPVHIFVLYLIGKLCM